MSNLNMKMKELIEKDDLEKVEKLLEEQLDRDPNNIDLLLKLAVLEQEFPFVDDKRTLSYLDKIFAIDKNNAKALLLFAYIHYYCLSGINDELLLRLKTLTTNNNEVNSMFRYTASWFVDDDNFRDKKLLLKESISLYKGHVYNYVHLAKIYLKEGKKNKAKDLINIALKNVQKIYTDENIDYDPTDIDVFINQGIKGIYLTEENFKRIKKLVDINK